MLIFGPARVWGDQRKTKKKKSWAGDARLIWFEGLIIDPGGRSTFVKSFA